MIADPKNTSLIIQGPLQDICQLDNLSNYSSYFDKIVLSIYKNSISLSEKVSNICKQYNILLNIIDKPHINENIYNYSNIYNQTISTLMGLSRITSDYVVKIRVDESYNLSNIYKYIIYDRINCSNIFFRSLKNNRIFPVSTNPTVEAFNIVLNRKYNCYRYHCSDHIISCNIKTMISAFNLCKMICENTDMLHNICDNIDSELLSCQPYHQYCLCPEQILALCFLHVLDPNTRIDFLDKQQNKELFQKHFNIINIENLKPYWVSAQKQLVNHIEDSKCYLVTDINHIQEL